jgi:short-subunit dehydrogenase
MCRGANEALGAASVEEAATYIIGGSSGMGLATARLLVADGGTVVLVARDEDKLVRRQKELESFGKGKVETIVADFYDWESVKALIARIDIETRHINRLVNAAGYFIPKTFLEYTEADYNGYMGLNRAFFFVVVRNMVKCGGGSIVNIGSMWAHQAIKATPSSAYSIQKAGLHALTKNLAMELGAHGVRVNAVAPAVTVTPLFNAFIDPKKVERPLVAIERASGSVNDICWSTVASICSLRTSRSCICSFSLAIFSLRRLVLVLSASDGSCRSAVSSCWR